MHSVLTGLSMEDVIHCDLDLIYIIWYLGSTWCDYQEEQFCIYCYTEVVSLVWYQGRKRYGLCGFFPNSTTDGTKPKGQCKYMIAKELRSLDGNHTKHHDSLQKQVEDAWSPVFNKHLKVRSQSSDANHL